jgi:serine/threonine protein phosphatase PrpC
MIISDIVGLKITTPPAAPEGAQRCVLSSHDAPPIFAPAIESMELLASTGTAQYPADLLAVNSSAGIVAVLDGVSEPYSSEPQPLLLAGATMGQTAVQTIGAEIMGASRNMPLGDIIIRANNALAAWITQLKDVFAHELQRRSLTLSRADERPGATGAVVRFDPGNDRLEIRTWGDSLALWQNTDGECGATVNQVYYHDMELRARISELMQKHHGDRNGMWLEFTPYLKAMRLLRANNLDAPCRYGYGVLNGEPTFPLLLQEVSLRLSATRCLILGSDGMFDYSSTSDTLVLAQELIPVFLSDGLEAVLEITRRQERADIAHSHLDFAEATAAGLRLMAR